MIIRRIRTLLRRGGQQVTVGLLALVALGATVVHAQDTSTLMKPQVTLTPGLTTVTVTWQPAEHKDCAPSEYVVMIVDAPTNNSAGDHVFVMASDPLSVTFSNLQSNREYRVQVRVFRSACGKRVGSDLYYVTTLYDGPTPVPTDMDMDMDMPMPATDTPIPATDTPIPATDTPIPATDTPIPATDTPIPATDTPIPATDTPIPATDTPIPATDTPIPATDTPIPATDTPIPATDTPIPATDTPIPATDTPIPATEIMKPQVTLTPGLTTVTVTWQPAEHKDCAPIEYAVTIVDAPTNNSAGDNVFVMASDPLSVTFSNLQSNREYRAQVTVFRSACGKRVRSDLYYVTTLNTGPEPTPVPADTDMPMPATDTPVPATDTPVPPTDTPVPATDTPVPATNTPGHIVVETAEDSNREVGGATATPVPRPPFRVRNVVVTASGTSATITWDKAVTTQGRNNRCLEANPQKYRYKVGNWRTGTQVMGWTETSQRAVTINNLTSGHRYAVTVNSYSEECRTWSERRRVFWRQP